MNSAILSVVLVTKFGFDRLHRIFEVLAEQSIAEHLEIVVVSPFDAPEPEPSPFARVRYVNCGPIESLGHPRALGVQACTAEFLVFGEDHCFPQPGWAEALVNRLREGWTGVGPLILNHNPDTWISQIDGLLNYGSFAPGCKTGPTNGIAPHNSAYPTAILQALGEDLRGLLEMDCHLQSRLLTDGGRLYLEPAAQTAHTNLSRPIAHWASQFNGNRIYGATRAAFHHWPIYRRGIYASAFLAIAGVRMWRARGNDPRTLPLLVLSAMIAAGGEACGYLFGLGASLQHRVADDLDRPSCLVQAERDLLR